MSLRLLQFRLSLQFRCLRFLVQPVPQYLQNRLLQILFHLHLRRQLQLYYRQLLPLWLLQNLSLTLLQHSLEQILLRLPPVLCPLFLQLMLRQMFLLCLLLSLLWNRLLPHRLLHHSHQQSAHLPLEIQPFLEIHRRSLRHLLCFLFQLFLWFLPVIYPRHQQTECFLQFLLQLPDLHRYLPRLQTVLLVCCHPHHLPLSHQHFPVFHPQL